MDGDSNGRDMTTIKECVFTPQYLQGDLPPFNSIYGACYGLLTHACGLGFRLFGAILGFFLKFFCELYHFKNRSQLSQSVLTNTHAHLLG